MLGRCNQGFLLICCSFGSLKPCRNIVPQLLYFIQTQHCRPRHAAAVGFGKSGHSVRPFFSHEHQKLDRPTEACIVSRNTHPSSQTDGINSGFSKVTADFFPAHFCFPSWMMQNSKLVEVLVLLELQLEREVLLSQC